MSAWRMWIGVPGGPCSRKVELHARRSIALSNAFRREFGTALATMLEAQSPNKAPPSVTKAPRPLPGEEYETAKPLPPVEDVVEELPPASDQPLIEEPAAPEAPSNAAAPTPITTTW